MPRGHLPGWKGQVGFRVRRGKAHSRPAAAHLTSRGTLSPQRLYLCRGQVSPQAAVGTRRGCVDGARSAPGAHSALSTAAALLGAHAGGRPRWLFPFAVS